MTAPQPSPGTSGGLPPVGSLAAEAAQLLDALALRLNQVRATVGDHVPVAGAPDNLVPDTADDALDGEPVPSDPSEADGAGARPPDGAAARQCVGWCPVCRSADLLRGERPEVAGKLVDSAIVVVAALRSLLPDVPADPAPGEPSTGPTRSTVFDEMGFGPAGFEPAAPGSGSPGGRAAAPSSGIERIVIR